MSVCTNPSQDKGGVTGQLRSAQGCPAISLPGRFHRHVHPHKEAASTQMGPLNGEGREETVNTVQSIRRSQNLRCKARTAPTASGQSVSLLLSDLSRTARRQPAALRIRTRESSSTRPSSRGRSWSVMTSARTYNMSSPLHRHPGRELRQYVMLHVQMSEGIYLNSHNL